MEIKRKNLFSWYNKLIDIRSDQVVECDRVQSSSKHIEDVYLYE